MFVTVRKLEVLTLLRDFYFIYVDRIEPESLSRDFDRFI